MWNVIILVKNRLKPHTFHSVLSYSNLTSQQSKLVLRKSKLQNSVTVFDRYTKLIVLSDIFYFCEDGRFSGISEGNENEYCVVRTQNWPYPPHFYFFLIYLNSPKVSQNIRCRIICLGNRELKMAWRGAVTKFELLFQHLAGSAQEPWRPSVRTDGK